jgi:hypothetical protein
LARAGEEDPKNARKTKLFIALGYFALRIPEINGE